MHTAGDSESHLWPKDVIVELEKAFVDERGQIQPLLETMMRSAVLIDSNKGALRANHYHKTDWHYCYVIRGSIEYYHRPYGAKIPPQKVIVPEGKMFFTPPLVEHAMKFPERSQFLTLSRNPRDQASYEADVVRVELIKP
jgi:quercetin dioxygenase-like cupin family protein